MKKGILFSLDALLAVLLFTSAFTSIMFLLQKESGMQEDLLLYSISSDSLAVLDIDGSLKSFSDGQTDKVNEFLSYALPSNVCARIDIETKNLSLIKPGCQSTNDVVVSKRIIDNDDYATMRAWYK